jgi:aspartate-semialdehyde dehydrogenase
MRRLAIVHPKTLVGKEILERVDAFPALAGERRLLSSLESEVGELADAGGAAFIGRLDEEAFDGVDLALFCGAIESEREVLARLPRRLAVVLASAGVTSSDAPLAVSGVPLPALAGVDRLASPHPLAVALTLLLAPLHVFDLRRAIATALLPVSLADEAAIDELFGEARALLTFQSPPKSKRFGAQLAFNAIPATLAPGELERATLAALGLDLSLSVQAIQAGIFHAVGVSLYVELGEAPAPADLRRALGRAPHLELAKQPGRFGPVAVAGGERLAIGEVRAADSDGSYWIWAAMDNLVRGAALNALELGEALLAAGRPS